MKGYKEIVFTLFLKIKSLAPIFFFLSEISEISDVSALFHMANLPPELPQITEKAVIFSVPPSSGHFLSNRWRDLNKLEMIHYIFY